MNNRNRGIDVFKGLLVIGMIFSHIICLFTDRNKFIFPQYITIFIDCITFSGFIFCFGYAYKIAYLSKEFKKIYMRILLNTYKIYLAYLISGLFYKLLIEKMDLTLKNVFKIALFYNVPILSEFLITFSLFSLFTLIAFNPLKWLLANKKMFWVTCAVLLLTAFIPAEFAKTNQIGLLIGSNKFGSFPLFQYMPIFLLGMYFAEYKIVFNIKFFISSIICTLIPFSYYVYTHNLPMRFPPSLLWIISPMFFLYCYYLISQHIKFEAIEFIGRNVLYYFLVSNIIMFSMRGATKFLLLPDPTAFKSLIAGIILIALITYMAKLTAKLAMKQTGNDVIESRLYQ